MEAVPKSDIKSVIKSDIRFDVSVKQTTWIGHYTANILIVNFHAFSPSPIYSWAIWAAQGSNYRGSSA